MSIIEHLSNNLSRPISARMDIIDDEIQQLSTSDSFRVRAQQMHEQSWAIQREVDAELQIERDKVPDRQDTWNQ